MKMADIQLDQNTVIIEGNVGVGTSSPVRMLHVEGSEIHSGGAESGFSFADRTKGNGERWLWYAQNGEAHLWSQKFGVNVVTLRTDTVGIGELTMPVGRLRAGALTTGLIEGVGPLTGGPAQVNIQGNVKVTGTLTQASSIALKENVSELSGQEAMAALQRLSAVKFHYKADAKKEQRLGFIAEDVPDLVATAERDCLSPMDLIAVLTRALQEQQQTITALAAKVDTLVARHGGNTV
jgi:Chaperone of endosialidase